MALGLEIHRGGSPCIVGDVKLTLGFRAASQQGLEARLPGETRTGRALAVDPTGYRGLGDTVLRRRFFPCVIAANLIRPGVVGQHKLSE